MLKYFGHLQNIFDFSVQCLYVFVILSPHSLSHVPCCVIVITDHALLLWCPFEPQYIKIDDHRKGKWKERINNNLPVMSNNGWWTVREMSLKKTCLSQSAHLVENVINKPCLPKKYASASKCFRGQSMRIIFRIETQYRKEIAIEKVNERK